jgi:UDP-2,3-diacylglucosamine pyrophosphatase LpxH
LSFSQKIKYSVKEAIKFVDDFEEKAIELAAEKGYDYVICGHIHMPQKRQITTAKGVVTYLNSGDWVENMTALEYEKGDWHIYTHNVKAFEKASVVKEKPTLNVVTEEVMLFMLNHLEIEGSLF